MLHPRGQTTKINNPQNIPEQLVDELLELIDLSNLSATIRFINESKPFYSQYQLSLVNDANNETIVSVTLYEADGFFPTESVYGVYRYNDLWLYKVKGAKYAYGDALIESFMYLVDVTLPSIYGHNKKRRTNNIPEHQQAQMRASNRHQGMRGNYDAECPNDLSVTLKGIEEKLDTLLKCAGDGRIQSGRNTRRNSPQPVVEMRERVNELLQDEVLELQIQLGNWQKEASNRNILIKDKDSKIKELEDDVAGLQEQLESVSEPRQSSFLLPTGWVSNQRGNPGVLLPNNCAQPVIIVNKTISTPMCVGYSPEPEKAIRVVVRPRKLLFQESGNTIPKDLSEYLLSVLEEIPRTLYNDIKTITGFNMDMDMIDSGKVQVIKGAAATYVELWTKSLATAPISLVFKIDKSKTDFEILTCPMIGYNPKYPNMTEPTSIVLSIEKSVRTTNWKQELLSALVSISE